MLQISETPASPILEYIKEGRRVAELQRNRPSFRSVRALHTLHRFVGRLKRALAVEPRRLGSHAFILQRILSATTMIKHREETMKKHLLLAFVGLATGSVLPALAQQKDTVDPKTEQQIRVKKLIQQRS